MGERVGRTEQKGGQTARWVDEGVLGVSGGTECWGEWMDRKLLRREAIRDLLTLNALRALGIHLLIPFLRTVTPLSCLIVT